MKPKVLLVDDDFCQIRTASRYFHKTGWTVLTALNGADGLGIALSSLPDLVIVDYSMPLMNGYDFTLRLHAEPQTRDIPVLMLSGSDPAEEVRNLAKQDAAFIGFLAKPASFMEIEKSIIRARASRPAQGRARL